MIAILEVSLSRRPFLMNDRMDASPVHAEPSQTDLEHLQLLGIFHYIVGGMMMLFSCFFIIHLVMGLVLAFNPQGFGPHRHDLREMQMEMFFGLLMAGFAASAILAGWTLGGLMIYSGTCLRKHRRRMFSQIMAGIVCMFMPFGTVLGVFTIVVLQRDSVRRLYGR